MSAREPGMTLTPYEAGRLLELRWICEPLNPCPALEGFTERMLRNEVIVTCGGSVGLMLTDKGNAWVDAILSVPEPVEVTTWSMPE